MAPTFYGASFNQAMLDKIGVSVTVGATTAKGMADTVDETELEASAVRLIAKSRAVRVVTGAFVGLAVGVAVTVDGSNYVVTSVRQVGDGAFTKFYCAPA